MSILVVRLVPEGLVFGADRNITSRVKFSNGTVETVVTGQSERPKVLKWPNREAITGYVGAAQIGGIPTDLWLYHSFIGNHLDFPDFATLAHALADDLNGRMAAGELQQKLIIHLGGFEDTGSDARPVVWFIRNTPDMTSDGEYILGSQFECSEELSQPHYPFSGLRAEEIRSYVSHTFFSFRQGYRLPAFNEIDAKLREAISTIIDRYPAQTQCHLGAAQI